MYGAAAAPGAARFRVAASTAPPADPGSSPGPPSWARALDLISLLILAVAVVVAESGGFRVHLGGWRVSLTSPLRLAVAAVALAAFATGFRLGRLSIAIFRGGSPRGGGRRRCRRPWPSRPSRGRRFCWSAISPCS